MKTKLEDFLLQRSENLIISDPKLYRIAEKVEEGMPITKEEGLYLFETYDFYGLISLSNYVTEKKHGSYRFFSVNRHINPTNYCINRCKFCAFSKSIGEEGGYELTLEEVLKKVNEAVKEGAKEIHLVSALHPSWPYSYYLGMVKEIKARYPAITLKAFTAVEIDHFSRISNKSISEVLSELKEAGLDCMPGGGAEIFDESIRSIICPEKITGKRWLEIHKTAHSLGIKTNCTMLYGHIEDPIHRIDHLNKLRELQEETGGFQSFVPLRYQVIEKVKPKKTTYGIDDIKTIAISRLMLNNIPHIKAYWIMLGENMAQFALIAGASEIEGTVYEEKIAHSAGAESPEYLEKSRIIKLIKDIGKTPVERDGLYRIVEVYS